MSITDHYPVLTDRAELVIQERLASFWTLADVDIADFAVRECLTCHLLLDGGEEIADHIRHHMENPA